MQIWIDESGGYNITVNNQIWLRSSRTAIYVDDRWYSTENKSLHLIDIATIQGLRPILGTWNETIFTYLVPEKNMTGIAASIRQWNMISAFTFYLQTSNTALTTKEALEKDDVRTVFPSFLIERMNENDE
jgi:hypothetical protein